MPLRKKNRWSSQTGRGTIADSNLAFFPFSLVPVITACRRSPADSILTVARQTVRHEAGVDPNWEKKLAR